MSDVTVYKHIKSEEPRDHWGMLNCKGHIVLDLGCGRHGTSVSTPEFFLNKGATKVYGVEMSHSEKPYYDSLNNPGLKVFTDQVTTIQQLYYYLVLLAPEVIKMDIEGYECLLAEISTDDMATVQEIAVEYHTQALRHLIEHNFRRLNFEHVEFYELTGFNPEEQGVIYLKK